MTSLERKLIIFRAIQSTHIQSVPLARLSIPTPRLVPAGASPKSLNWDS